MSILNDTEKDELIIKLRERINKLEWRMQDELNVYKEIMAEVCDGSDNRKHCTCVPPLKIRVRALEAALKAMVLAYGDDDSRSEEQLNAWLKAYEITFGEETYTSTEEI